MLDFKKPLAIPPARNWRYDLPGPNDPPTIRPYPPGMSHAPNYVNEVFLDLPREEIMHRGFCSYLLLITILTLLSIPATQIAYLIILREFPPLALIGITLPCVFFGLWLTVYYLRIGIESPLDSPIRFNRARRKVYIYRFHHSGRNLFSKTGWGVKPIAYDWDHLHAEFCSTYGPMGGGGLVEYVTLAVVEPITKVVHDRFIFAHRGHEAEMYWALAQIFMQQGPQALPIFDKPPRDWNNEEHILNFARRFAPKVKWPEDMDRESRTAP